MNTKILNLFIIIKMTNQLVILLNVILFTHKKFMTSIIVIHYVQIKNLLNQINYHNFNNNN
jgi:hypothetical protein